MIVHYVEETQRRAFVFLIPVFVHFYAFDEGSFSFRSSCDKRVLLPNAKERERDLSEEKRAPHFYHIFTRNEHEKKKDTDILNMLINKSKKPRAVI